ncbi:isochorismatase hydrolase [Phlyctema vagabunda]|uniref:Isochorismatase hydrolase n=1 Tax=Phlyctema vagabunda TaxID=108571 RepID=A0ABR4P304_9HELO
MEGADIKSDGLRTSFAHRVSSCLLSPGLLKRSQRAARPTQYREKRGLRNVSTAEDSTSLTSDMTRHAMQASIDAAPYRWPHDSSFHPTTTALVIIDMQRDFCSPEGYMSYQGYDISASRAIIPRLQVLLSIFREKGFPIYFTREGHRPNLSTLSSREEERSRNNSGVGIGDRGPLGRLLIRGELGHEIVPELKPLDNEDVIDKPGRSAFQHTDLGLLLSVKGIKNLILCGVTTDVCVSSTMREANDNNFDCLLVEDATAAAEPELHQGAVQTVKGEGGIFGAVTSTAQILAALNVT